MQIKLRAQHYMVASIRAGRVIANAARVYANLNRDQRKLVDEGKHHLLGRKHLNKKTPPLKKEVNPITGF